MHTFDDVAALLGGVTPGPAGFKMAMLRPGQGQGDDAVLDDTARPSTIRQTTWKLMANRPSLSGLAWLFDAWERIMGWRSTRPVIRFMVGASSVDGQRRDPRRMSFGNGGSGEFGPADRDLTSVPAGADWKAPPSQTIASPEMFIDGNEDVRLMKA